MNIIDDIRCYPQEKVLFLGIGNTSRGDDGAGPYFISALSARAARHKYKFFDCGTMPENFFGKIKALAPSLIVFVDAADYRGKKGEIRALGANEIAGMSASTHHMPLTALAKFLSAEILPAPRFIFLGVQAASLDVGGGLGGAIANSADNFVSFLLK